MNVMSDRLNWGAIFAGSLVALATCYALGFLLWSIAGTAAGYFGANILFPTSYGECVFAVLFSGLGFTAGSAVTILTARLGQIRPSLLHSLTSLGISLLAVHFLFRDAFFYGRPGLPLTMQFGFAIQPMPAYVAWTICLSIMTSVLANVSTAFLVSRTLAKQEHKTRKASGVRAASDAAAA